MALGCFWGSGVRLCWARYSWSSSFRPIGVVGPFASPHPRLSVPNFTIPSGSPAGSLLKGFSYLYAPLSFPHLRRDVAGRLGDAIARIDAVDPSLMPERVSQAMQETADVVDPEELPPAPGGEPVINLFDQARRREEARRKEQA